MRKSSAPNRDKQQPGVSVVKDIIQLIAHLIQRVLDEIALLRTILTGQRDTMDEILDIVKRGEDDD